MSDSFNPIPTTINRELIERIEHLNLSITQRHHVRLLVHCMQVFQDISASNNGIFPTDDLLRFWCQAQAIFLEPLTTNGRHTTKAWDA